MNILVVSQYFWPENMRINDMVVGFQARGHKVTVLTGVPNYPEGKVFAEYEQHPELFEQYAGADVIRIPMFARGRSSLRLMLNYASFFTSASVFGAYKLRGRQFDAIFVYAVSPIMAAIPALVIGRLKKAPVYVWILDLWPETLTAVGVLNNRRLLSMVGKMVSWIYNRTDYLLLQSQGFFENVKRYCTQPIDEQRLVYLPSWAEDGFSESGSDVTELFVADASVFTVVFAGNLGESQDFPAILDAAKQLQDEGVAIRWVIVGDGRMSEWLREQVAERELSSVLLLGRHSLDKMPALFNSADALLVSLRTNEVFAKTIPGKVQAYLAAGRPIIGMIDGEAARVIHEAQAGLACMSGDANGLASAVSEMANMSPNQLQAMGLSGREYYQNEFDKEKLFDRLEVLFRQGVKR